MAINHLVAMFRLIKVGNLVDLPWVRGIAFHRLLLLYSVSIVREIVLSLPFTSAETTSV